MAHAYMITHGGHKVLSILRQRNVIIGRRVCYVVCCNEDDFGTPLYDLRLLLLLLNMLEYSCFTVCKPFTSPVGFVMSWLTASGAFMLQDDDVEEDVKPKRRRRCAQKSLA